MSFVLSPGIPPRLIRDTQSYELVALIDGAGANTQFVSNLQVVTQQRRAVADLATKLAAAPAAERTALQEQHDRVAASLAQNLEFMVKHYGYSTQRNYLLVPVRSALLLKALGEDGKPSDDEAKATFVTELVGPDAYEDLQALRTRALEAGAAPERAAEFAELKEALRTRFQFEVGRHYLLQIRKGALYATVV